MEPIKKWTQTYFQDIAQCGQELVVLITQIDGTLSCDDGSKSKMEDLYVRLNVKGSEMSQLCTSKLRKRNQNSKGTGITVPENMLVQIERSSTDFLLRVGEVEKAIKDFQNKKATSLQNSLSLSSSSSSPLTVQSAFLSSSSSSSSPPSSPSSPKSPKSPKPTQSSSSASLSPDVQHRSSLSPHAIDKSQYPKEKEPFSLSLSSNDAKCAAKKIHLKECLDELLSSLKRLLLVGSQITKVESKRQVPPIILCCKSRTSPTLAPATDGSSSSASGSSSSLVSLSSNSLVVMRPAEIDITAHGAVNPESKETIGIVRSESEKLISVLENYCSLLKGQAPLEMKKFQELIKPLTEGYQRVYNATIALGAVRLGEEFRDRFSLLLGLLKAVAAKPDEMDFRMHALKSILSLIEYKVSFNYELLRTSSLSDSASVSTDHTTSTSTSTSSNSTAATTITATTTVTTSSSDSSSGSGSNKSGGVNCCVAASGSGIAGCIVDSSSSGSSRERTVDFEFSPPNYNVTIDYDKSSSSSDSDSLSSIGLLSPNVSELEHIIRVKNEIISRLKKTISTQAEEIRSLADAIAKSPPHTPVSTSSSSDHGGENVVCEVLKAREEAVHRREEALDSLYESYNNDLDDYKRKHGAFALEKKKYEKEKKRLREERMRLKEAKDAVQRDLALVKEERRQLEAQRAAEIGAVTGENGKHARRATSPLEVGKFAKSAAATAGVKFDYSRIVKREHLYKFAAEHVAILAKHYPEFASGLANDGTNLVIIPAPKASEPSITISPSNAGDSGKAEPEKPCDDEATPGTKKAEYQNDLDAIVEKFCVNFTKSKSTSGSEVSGTETDDSDNERRERRDKRKKRRSHRHRKSSSSRARKDDNCDPGKQPEKEPETDITTVGDDESKEKEAEKKVSGNENDVGTNDGNENDGEKVEVVVGDKKECEISAEEENGGGKKVNDAEVLVKDDGRGKEKYEALKIEISDNPEAHDAAVLVESGVEKLKDSLLDESCSSFGDISPNVFQRQSSVGSSAGSEYSSTASSSSSDLFEYGNPISDAMGLCQHINDILRDKVNLKAIFRWNRVLVEFRLLRAMFPGYVASQRDAVEVDELHARVARYHGSVMLIASKFGNVTVKASTSMIARLTAELLSGTPQKEPINSKKNIERSRKYLLALLRAIKADLAFLKSSETLVKIASMVIADIERMDITGSVNKDLIAAAECSQHLREVILTEAISSVSIDCGHIVTLTSQILAIVCRMPFAMDSASSASAPLWELCTCAYRFTTLLSGLAARFETSKCLRAILCASRTTPSFFTGPSASTSSEGGSGGGECEGTRSTDSTPESEGSGKGGEKTPSSSSPLWDEALRGTGKSTPRVLTLDELIYRITDPDNIDALTLRTAVVTSLSFAEPKVFLGKLIERFNAPSWVEESTVIKVRTRVILVLTHFIEAQFDDFDVDTLRMLQDFIDGPIMHSSAALGVILRKDYERKARISRQRLLVTQIPTTTLSISPSTRSPLELFFELDEATVARQLTMATFAVFSAVEPKELLERAWARPKLLYRAQNVVRLIERSKLLGQLVGILVLAHPTPESRAKALEKILRVIASLNKLNNFNDMAAMHAGLKIPAVRRLNDTRDLVDPKCLKMLKYCDKMFSEENAFKHYKHALDDAEGPTIPLISVVLDELASIDSGDGEIDITITETENSRPGLINFKKRLAEYSLIEDIQQYQKAGYSFPIIEPLYAVFTTLPSCSEEILYDLSLIYEPKKPSVSSKLSSKSFKSSRKTTGGGGSLTLR